MRGLVRWGLWIAAIVGAIGVLLHLFVFETWIVPTDGALAASIAPTLLPQDKLLVHRAHPPGFGQLARCASPVVPGAHVVGRVFGVAGDRVEVSDGEIATNGKAIHLRHRCAERVVPHPITANLVTLSCGVADNGAWSFEYLWNSQLPTGTHLALVEPGKLYLVSDNRVMRQDSRDFGQVDASTCEHIVYRLWGEKFSDAQRRFTVLW